MKAEDLKNSILQMAMEGKLVPQDPNDEPASVLLEKIHDKKEKLIKEKKIKRNNKESFIFRKNGHFYERIGKKGEPVCIDDELPFDIPDNWEWCRFGHIVNFSLGKTPPRKEPIFWDDAKIPWVSISDMVDGKIINTTKENVNNYALEKSFKGILIPKGTLLMSFKLTVGKVSILGLDAVHNEAIISINPFVDENNCFRDYLFRILPLISQTGDTKSAIKGKTLNSKSLNKLLIPLPSLKEQKRIINKIEDILPLIEEYGVNEEQLDKLNSEFPDKLRSSILQEAVQGKLVPQDPTDEPASVLLEKIKEEKERLIKEKKIKRNKNESVIYKKNNHFYEKIGNDEPICIDDEIPFEMPESWECVRLGAFNEIERGGSPRPIKQYITEDSNGINWIKIGDTIKGDKYIYSTKEKIKPEGMKKSRYVEEGDFLLTNSMSFGRPYILKTNGCIHDGWLVIKLNDKLFYQDFMFYLLSSNFIFEQFSKLSAGSAVKNLKIDSVKKVFVPVPPLNEQKRIVKKIEEILPFLH